jgi:hypothetical protein
VFLITLLVAFWPIGGQIATEVAGRIAATWHLPGVPLSVSTGVLFVLQFFGTAGGLGLAEFYLSRHQLAGRDHLSPNEGIRRSGKNGLVMGLLGALAGAPPAVLLDGLPGVLFFGLFFGLPFGLFFGLAAFIEHFVLRTFLWRTTSLPWNLISFLDEAAERLLLRKVGGSYMFVHRLLLEYIATLDEPMPSESTFSENSQDSEGRY